MKPLLVSGFPYPAHSHHHHVSNMSAPRHPGTLPRQPLALPLVHLSCHVTATVYQPDLATSPDDVSMTSSDLDPTNDVMLTSTRIRAKSVKRSILAKNSRFLSFWCVRRYSALHANNVQIGCQPAKLTRRPPAHQFNLQSRPLLVVLPGILHRSSSVRLQLSIKRFKKLKESRKLEIHH